MKRSDFLLSLVGPAVLGAVPRSTARIRSLSFTPIEGRFHKLVAMNSHSTAPGNGTYTNTLVRIRTDQGVEGLGVMDYSRPDPGFLSAVKTLVGTDPLSLFLMKNGRVVGRAPEFEPLLIRYRHLDAPLLDLVGKLTGAACWKLIGDAAREKIEVYDGTLYFSDVWFRDRGVRAVLEEVEESLKKGYVGMKFKVGRGWRWMEMNAGIRRDIEIVRAARKAGGPELKILTDANNAYEENFEGAWRFLNETRDLNLYWFEEAFPESVEGYTRLKDRMEKSGIRTLIADGENFRDPRAFEPYLRPRRLMDVLQLDIRRGGFLGCLEMARLGDPHGAHSIPHNWGSQVGGLMGLQLSKAVRSVTAAEDDRSTCDAIVADRYVFSKGFYTVPDAPGMGIDLNEAVYGKKYQAKEVVVS
jgi:L-alanine-DL-glutamate epimerase-like enolase superfamily enzyme